MEELTQSHTTVDPNTGDYNASIDRDLSYLDETLASEANTFSTSHQFTQPKEPSTEADSTDTTATPQATQSLVPSSSSNSIIVLVVTLVVILLLLDVGGVLFLVCVLRAKASRREGREDGERNIQVIGMQRNEPHGHIEMMRVDSTKISLVPRPHPL